MARAEEVFAWEPCQLYRVGFRRCWRGVWLVCTREHYAGDAAEHPWDPGDGWEPGRAALLWTPDGPEQAQALSALLADYAVSVGGADRLYQVLDEAIG